MSRMRLRLPWQLKLKSLFLLLAAISLTLVLFALYMRGHSIRFPHAVRKINPASMARNFFSAEDMSEVEFMHIERQWKEPEWKIVDVLHRVGAMKQKLVPVVVVEEHHEAPSKGQPLPKDSPYQRTAPTKGQPLPTDSPYQRTAPTNGQPLPKDSPYQRTAPTNGQPLPKDSPYQRTAPTNGQPLPKDSPYQRTAPTKGQPLPTDSPYQRTAPTNGQPLPKDSPYQRTAPTKGQPLPKDSPYQRTAPTKGQPLPKTAPTNGQPLPTDSPYQRTSPTKGQPLPKDSPYQRREETSPFFSRRLFGQGSCLFLKYWFDAAAVGVIPQSGNTLLHIDGHSDAAPPRDLSIVPWFHLPRSHSQVANMMQSNDVFIAGAALTGLISRYIWVWPDWDYADHVNDSHHSVADVIAGWRIYSPPDGKPFQRHCACMRTRLPHSQSEGWECWNDESDLTDIGGSSVIKSKQCKAVLTAVVENVHEKKALELLKSGDWIRQDERVLLDIDEDYFGCESSVMPLYNAGLTQDFINQLSDLVSQFLCVNEVRFELIADKVFHTAVQIVRDFKTNLCGEKQSHDQAGCVSEFEADKALIHLIPKFTKTLRKAEVFTLMCHGTSGEVILQILLRMLFSLNFKQLDALNYVGMCLETAPTSMAYEPDSLHICHGFNIPSDTQVTFHVPTVKENAMRSEILKNTLSLLPQQPKLVTVCRSMRDGYTPWAVFSAVEKSVMGILRSVFPGVAEDSFHFDENLLGGKKGWPERHHH
ncbi:hypothetical protein ACOMHN_061220 [Nucella lapillus]